MTNLFVEESLPDYSYQIVWNGEDFTDALSFLQTSESDNRLELWSREHAGTVKGFAPMALRGTRSKDVLIANTLRMLMGA